MARIKDGIYWDFCYQECMKLTEDNNLTEKTLEEVYDKIVQIILEDNLFLKTVMSSQGKLKDFLDLEESMIAKVKKDLDTMFEAGNMET